MKQETFEEAAKRLFAITLDDDELDRNKLNRFVWLKGGKRQKEKMYSEEDMKDAYIQGTLGLEYKKSFNESFYRWFEQFKKK